MEKRTALVFGTTGLVGNALVNELLKDNRYGVVKLFARRETGYSGQEKVVEYIFDFSKLSDYSGQMKGDDLFICLGTTIKRAGTVQKMEEIDRDLPVRIATIAFANSVERAAVVSSIGANPASSNYYLRIKGEMEKGLTAIKFGTLIIGRPSILFGPRKEKRAMEGISKFFMKIFGILFVGGLSKYKGIEAADVSKALINAINEKSGTVILESDELQYISRE